MIAVGGAAISRPRELTPEEKAEIIRLYTAEVNAGDLEQSANWAKATLMDDVLSELEKEQKQWGEKNP